MAHKDDTYRPCWAVCPACIRRAHKVLAENDKRADHGTRKLKAVVLIESRPETYCRHCQLCSECGLTGTVDAPEMEHSIRENERPNAFWASTAYAGRDIEHITRVRPEFRYAGIDKDRGWLLGKKGVSGITHKYLGQWKEENGQVFILVEPLYKFVVGVDMAVGKDETVTFQSCVNLLDDVGHKGDFIPKDAVVDASALTGKLNANLHREADEKNGVHEIRHIDYIEPSIQKTVERDAAAFTKEARTIALKFFTITPEEGADPEMIERAAVLVAKMEGVVFRELLKRQRFATTYGLEFSPRQHGKSDVQRFIQEWRMQHGRDGPSPKEPVIREWVEWGLLWSPGSQLGWHAESMDGLLDQVVRLDSHWIQVIENSELATHRVVAWKTVDKKVWVEVVRLDCDHTNAVYSHETLTTSCPDCGFTETDLEQESAETK